MTHEASSVLTVSSLSHAFGGLKAISAFDLTVMSGDSWGIIGPNGAGKTTVFNLITGVYRPDHGTVVLRGENLVGLPSHRIVARGIARTFQNIRLFKTMTVLDNVLTGAYCRLDYPVLDALVRTRRGRRAESELRDAACGLLDKFGLDDRRYELAVDLSYGMQRKVELARALISKPVVLLLDEPGAGMNPAELDGLCDLILWMQQEFKVATIVIEHRMHLVMKVCRQLRVLNFGQTIYTGSPQGLSADPAVVSAYFGEDHAAA